MENSQQTAIFMVLNFHIFWIPCILASAFAIIFPTDDWVDTLMTKWPADTEANLVFT